MRGRHRRSRQTDFDFRPRKWGGKRKRAGRKAGPGRERFLRHVERPDLDPGDPVHVTARVARDVPFLPTQRIYAALKAIFARISEKGFRLLQFSVQANHLHMIVEASSEVALGRGMKRLLSRVAMMVNAIARRHGKVFPDRYSRQDILSASHFRNVLVYVLFNARKHDTARDWAGGVDTYSSTVWFTDWAEGAGPAHPETASSRHGPSIVAPPQTWLARTGWKLHGGGPLRLDDVIAS